MICTMAAERPAACRGSAFEDRYSRNPDPWDFAASAYERHRYRTVMEALPQFSYGRAFEPGCSVGELTAQLAEVCGHVTATDVAPSAVERARQRCAAFVNVEIYCADLALLMPAGRFDLIIFSELGYYFPMPMLGRITQALAHKLNPGGDFVAVHWLGQSEDHVLHGDEVHDLLQNTLPLKSLGGERHAGFRIDCWRQS